MPRTAVDYSKTLIYKLVHKDDLENENIYVGSTTDFRRRKWSHKSSCTNVDDVCYNLKVYQNIRENEGWDNWVMLEIEKFPCTDKREAELRERYWCEYYRSKLNSQVPRQSRDEYYENHKEEIKGKCKKYYEENPEKRKEYLQNNVEKIKQYSKEYYDKNYDKIKEYRENSVERMKEYLQNNAEKIKQQTKNYRTNNAEKIKEHKNEKITCDKCGMFSSRQNLIRHKKTEKCINSQKM